MQINIIGAGRVGQTLGHLLVKSGIGRIGAVVNQTMHSALRAVDFIGEGVAYTHVSKLPNAQLTVITTPDPVIASVCERLALNQQLRQGDGVIHCSGLLTSDSLFAASQRGCWVASVHPMRSFADPLVSVLEYAGTLCAVEGDALAVERIRAVFDAMGSVTYVIAKEHKAIYHTAGVFASNYVLTLVEQARLCLQQAQVDEALIMPLIMQLMRGTLTNVRHTSPRRALTGPIQRGDTSTVRAHLNALSSGQQRVLYAALGRATVTLTALDEVQKQALLDEFNQ